MVMGMSLVWDMAFSSEDVLIRIHRSECSLGWMMIYLANSSPFSDSFQSCLCNLSLLEQNYDINASIFLLFGRSRCREGQSLESECIIGRYFVPIEARSRAATGRSNDFSIDNTGGARKCLLQNKCSAHRVMASRLLGYAAESTSFQLSEHAVLVHDLALVAQAFKSRQNTLSTRYAHSEFGNAGIKHHIIHNP